MWFGYLILISLDFDDFFLFRLRRYIKHSRQCFISYPNTSNFVLFSVFGYPDETLSLVFDILLRGFLMMTMLVSKTNVLHVIVRLFESEE